MDEDVLIVRAEDAPLMAAPNMSARSEGTGLRVFTIRAGRNGCNH